jgi:hypothetical protein
VQNVFTNLIVQIVCFSKFFFSFLFFYESFYIAWTSDLKNVETLAKKGLSE